MKYLVMESTKLRDRKCNLKFPHWYIYNLWGEINLYFFLLKGLILNINIALISCLTKLSMCKFIITSLISLLNIHHYTLKAPGSLKAQGSYYLLQQEMTGENK